MYILLMFICFNLGVNAKEIVQNTQMGFAG